MSFNPDHTKPTHGVVFGGKINETHHLMLMMHNVPVKRVSY